MSIIIGVALIAVAALGFLHSLPRGGKVARFVGTQWEGYAVVMMLAVIGVGVIMTISGLAELAK